MVSTCLQNLLGVVKRLRLWRCGVSRSGFCFVEHENQAREHQQRGEGDPRPFNAITAWAYHRVIFGSEVSCRNTLELVLVGTARG